MTEERLDTLLQEHFAPLRMARPPAPRRWRAWAVGAGGIACAAAALLLLVPRPLSAQEVLDLGDARLRDVPYVEIRMRLGDAPFGEPDVLTPNGWLIRNDVGGSGLAEQAKAAKALRRIMLRTAEGEWIYNPGADFLLFSKGVRPLQNDQVFSKLLMEHYMIPRESPVFLGEVQTYGAIKLVSAFAVAGPVERVNEGGRSYRALNLKTNPKWTFGRSPMIAQALFHPDGRPHSVKFQFLRQPEPGEPAKPTTQIDFSYPTAPNKPFAEFPLDRRPDLDVNAVLARAERARAESGVPCLPAWAPGGAVLLNCGPSTDLQEAAGKQAFMKKIPGLTPPPAHIRQSGSTLVMVDDQGGTWFVERLWKRSQEIPGLSILFPMQTARESEPTFWGVKPMGAKSSSVTPEALQVNLAAPGLERRDYLRMKAQSEAMVGRTEQARLMADRVLELARSELGTDEMYRRTFIRWGILPPEDGIVIWPPRVRR
jgi:hypothetical protein